MTLYERIKSICDERKISIYRIEKECGLGNGSIMKWENSSPKIDNIIKLANYFDVSIDYLLGRELSQTKKVVQLERHQNVVLLNYKENCENLSTDEFFVNITQIYANLETAIRSVLYGELVKWLENHGVCVAEILGF